MNTRPNVAHVNYHYFLSTQSFISFYLGSMHRYRPICLTRTPETEAIREATPSALQACLRIYGEGDGANSESLVWRCGRLLRRSLSHMPLSLARPGFHALNSWVIPRLRNDSDPDRYLAWVRDILVRESVQLIHAYFGPVGWRMLTLKRQLNLPLIVSLLGDDVSTSLDPWWWWIVQKNRRDKQPNWPERMQELFSEADLILVEGEYLREKLIGMGADRSRVAVQRIALPLASLPYSQANQEAKQRTTILFAGRFCERKGILDALEAIARLWKVRQDFEFVMIGDETLTDGLYASSVHEYIRRLRLGKCVRLLGFVDHSRYLDELSRANIFLHPSHVDSHGRTEGGAPTTILEAQAMGVAVVATQHCDIPNITLPGTSALLVGERNPADLAAALMSLLDDPERRIRMGKAGRRFVARNHDVALEVHRLEKHYDELLCR